MPKESAESDSNSVCYKTSKLTDLNGFFSQVLAMPSGKQFDVAEKSTIMGLFREGVSAKDIAKGLNRNAAAVRKIIAANRNLTPFTPPPPAKKRSGRPRLTTNREDERLRRYVLRNPFKTAKEIKSEVPGWKNASVRLIQHVCQKRLKILSRAAAKKPLLTSAMVKKRLRFCKKHLHWTEKDWETVMFSDESTFKLINPRSQRVRRPTGINRYKQRYVTVNVKHPPSVMIWGCFCGVGGRGSLYFLPPKVTMNGERYLEMLRDKLLPWMSRLGATKFLQDGAPCHKSKKVMAFFEQNDIDVMDWPGNSPDLNPIENLWAIMKAKLKKDASITSLPLLMKAIKLIWVKDLPIDLMKKLAHSMPARIRQCIANKGQMTKY
jgi:transposase